MGERNGEVALSQFSAYASVLVIADGTEVGGRGGELPSQPKKKMHGVF